MDVTLVPEPTYWVLSWKKPPSTAKLILISFDSSAILPSELAPAVPRGDGTIELHAFQGMTNGEKLRFEPQPHKNTVGYWTIPTDSVSWRFSSKSPGTYSIGLLQGCGEGQGASRASIEIVDANGVVVAQQEFVTIDTGHFQNFRWNHVGHVEIPSGNLSLRIKPIQIAKGALFDVRTIQLVKQAKK
jgi:hypothetical protein